MNHFANKSELIKKTHHIEIKKVSLIFSDNGDKSKEVGISLIDVGHFSYKTWAFLLSMLPTSFDLARRKKEIKTPKSTINTGKQIIYPCYTNAASNHPFATPHLLSQTKKQAKTKKNNIFVCLIK